MKTRTLISLDPDDLRHLRSEARARRISLAELLRRVVKEHLGRRHEAPAATPQTYLKLIGLGASGRDDISERHDFYLADALRREHAR